MSVKLEYLSTFLYSLKNDLELLKRRVESLEIKIEAILKQI